MENQYHTWSDPEMMINCAMIRMNDPEERSYDVMLPDNDTTKFAIYDRSNEMFQEYSAAKDGLEGLLEFMLQHEIASVEYLNKEDSAKAILNSASENYIGDAIQPSMKQYVQALLQNDAATIHTMLKNNKRTIDIYQIVTKRDDPLFQEKRQHSFMDFKLLHKLGMKFDPSLYSKVYRCDRGDMKTLDDIFTKFNIDRPNDFTGHSLSISDIIVCHDRGIDKAYFVDGSGYQEVPEFLQAMKRDMPTNQQERLDHLVNDILNFGENYDPYEYHDQYESHEQAVDEIKKQLSSVDGQLTLFTKLVDLYEYSNDNEDIDDSKQLNSLIHSLKQYQPPDYIPKQAIHNWNLNNPQVEQYIKQELIQFKKLDDDSEMLNQPIGLHIFGGSVDYYFINGYKTEDDVYLFGWCNIGVSKLAEFGEVSMNELKYNNQVLMKYGGMLEIDQHCKYKTLGDVAHSDEPCGLEQFYKERNSSSLTKAIDKSNSIIHHDNRQNPDTERG